MKFFQRLIYTATALFIGGLILKLAWNGVLPELFKLPVITYWQAFGINLICHQLLHQSTISVSRAPSFLDRG